MPLEMVEHLDFYGKKLEKGIYKSIKSKNLLYFTGKYNEYEEACFKDNEEVIINLPFHSSELLKKIEDKEIREKISWLERGLKK